ncbi:MAG: RNA replicase beta chain [Sanya fiers-like virus 9]|nr:MAG: RNA replicase beta chain [Sanya fiers-like virus 9]
MFSHAFRKSFYDLASSLNTPRALSVWLLFDSGNHAELLELRTDPMMYLDSDINKFRDDYLVTEYLSKYKGLQTGIDTKRVALDSFVTAESQCKATNDRIRALWVGRGISQWSHVFCMAQMKIQQCIGTHPKWSKLADRFRWSGGATFSLCGEDVRLDYKLREERISVTKSALPYLRFAMAEDYAWLAARGINCDGPTSLLTQWDYTIVNGGRGLTVDKNAKTDRFIVAEPTGNMFLQLGVGGYFRQCLARAGIDLSDQTINQSLARDALTLGLATVDLKAASDTISKAVVWHLLPHAWASFLDDIRSKSVLVEGEWVPLEKFSSMGNGFTFELETLIFWALTESLRDYMGFPGRVSVYGDDIICPSELVPHLLALFSEAGFTANLKKTHFEGLFRESCGAHFFNGRDVSPIYQKEVLDCEIELYRAHNRLLYHAIDRGWSTRGSVIADKTFRSATKRLRTMAVEYGSADCLALPIQSDKNWRTLDGALLTCVRSLVYRNAGTVHSPGRVRTRVLAFKPAKVDAHHDAVYAWYLRRNAVRRPSFEDGGRWPVAIEDLSFTGKLDSRGRGRWRLKTRRFPEACDLTWS